jgi:hypothetical protein
MVFRAVFDDLFSRREKVFFVYLFDFVFSFSEIGSGAYPYPRGWGRGAGGTRSLCPSLILPSACCILLQSLTLKSQSSISGRRPSQNTRYGSGTCDNNNTSPATPAARAVASPVSGAIHLATGPVATIFPAIRLGAKRRSFDLLTGALYLSASVLLLEPDCARLRHGGEQSERK